MTAPERPLVPLPEVCALLGFVDRTIIGWGVTIKLGRRRYVPRAKLEALLRGERPTATEATHVG